MTDILDNQILCRKCGKAMKKGIISKNGFNLRAVKCEKCGELILHPADKQEYDNFMALKNKEFEVKMRMVGNSYAVSIPREIVDFMKEQENMINNMVRLSFQEAGRLSLMFNMPDANENNSEKENMNNTGNQFRSRVIQAKEYKVIKNNKPVIHVRQIKDSANPKNNKTHIFKAIKNNEDIEEDL